MRPGAKNLSRNFVLNFQAVFAKAVFFCGLGIWVNGFVEKIINIMIVKYSVIFKY